MESVPYQTDKQIKDETDELMIDCIKWAFTTFWGDKFFPELSSEDVRSIGISRFIYLQEKLLNHSPKYYREKEKKERVGGTAIIKEG